MNDIDTVTGTLTFVLECRPDLPVYYAKCLERPSYTSADPSPEGAIIRLFKWLKVEPTDAC